MNPRISVVELRQYTLFGGRRDELISLFEREFVESQEALGMRILGTFRDLDDPDRFVWLRGFPDMAQRRTALEAFYGGPVWRAHRDAANATMLDSDNVLLLHALDRSEELLHLSRASSSHVVRVAIHSLRDTDPMQFAEFFERYMLPQIEHAGGRVFARLLSEKAANDFRLPVRENDPVFVWFSGFETEEAERRFSERLRQSSGWRDSASAAVLPALMRKPEILRLT